MPILSQNQLILLDEFKEDIEFYKTELKRQIKNSKMISYSAIGFAILVGVILLLKPELLDSLKALSEHMGMVAGIVGEVLPVALASKSFNSSKIIRKKLNGLRIFEKDLHRMEMNIIPNSQDNIMSLEQELMRYINT